MKSSLEVSAAAAAAATVFDAPDDDRLKYVPYLEFKSTKCSDPDLTSNRTSAWTRDILLSVAKLMQLLRDRPTLQTGP